jgi:hypothetical protein
VRPIRRSDHRTLGSTRRGSQRALVITLGAVLVMLASGCNGSTAPEPGEHETKHEEATETLRAVSLLTPQGHALAAGAANGRGVTPRG